MSLMVGLAATGSTPKFMAFDTSLSVYNGSAFVSYNAANIATYRLTATAGAVLGSLTQFYATMPEGTAWYALIDASDNVVWTEPVTDLSAVTSDLASLLTLTETDPDDAEKLRLTEPALANVNLTPVTDAIADVQADTTAIRAKTSLLGTGSVTLTSAVTQTGTLNPINAGDDYTVGSLNGPLLFALPVDDWGDLSEHTPWFIATKNNSVITTGAIEGEILNANTPSQQARIELTSTNTAALLVGSTSDSVAVNWELELRHNTTGVSTVIRGSTTAKRNLFA